jgi:citrate lyase subunit beta/citryl-CoA lyase
MAPLHPRDALRSEGRVLPALAPCEHFAGSRRLVEKALELQVSRGGDFDVTFDLEDGAPAGREELHARAAVEVVNGPGNAFGRVGVRVHDARHPSFFADVELVIRGAGARVAYLTLPKVRSAAELDEGLAVIRAASRAAGLARSIPVHVLIETHGALREVWAIAARPELETLDFGLMDFVSDHQGAISAESMRSPGQFEHALIVRAKAELAAAALAHGLIPAHNVTLALKDPAQARADAEQAARRFGFLRMWSVHPAQIEPIVAALRPTAAEVEHAGVVLLAACAADWGPIEHGGQLFDRGSYRHLWGLLERARRARVPLGPAVEAAFFAEA